MIVGDIIKDKSQCNILKSIMPGGKNWKEFVRKGGTCYESCPAFQECRVNKNCPNNICSRSWRSAELSSEIINIFCHIFDNFDDYNRNDLPGYTQETEVVKKLQAFFNSLSKSWSDEHLDEEILNINSPESETTKKALIDARVGQTIFRCKLIDYWQGCAITGLREEDLLRASHIKPWRNSNDKERLDVFNGLLLIPNLDLAFDKGFITFDDDGVIIISDRLTEIRRKILKIHDNLKIKSELLTEEHRAYLQYHRENVFEN